MRARYCSVGEEPPGRRRLEAGRHARGTAARLHRAGDRPRGRILPPWRDYRAVLTYLREETSPRTRIANVLRDLPRALTGPAARLPVFPAQSIAWLAVKPGDEADFLSALEDADEGCDRRLGTVGGEARPRHPARRRRPAPGSGGPPPLRADDEVRRDRNLAEENAPGISPAPKPGPSGRAAGGGLRLRHRRPLMPMTEGGRPDRGRSPRVRLAGLRLRASRCRGCPRRPRTAHPGVA